MASSLRRTRDDRSADVLQAVVGIRTDTTQVTQTYCQYDHFKMSKRPL